MNKKVIAILAMLSVGLNVLGGSIEGTSIGVNNAALGMPTVGRAVTATLYVSPNGDNTSGTSWARAYQTIQGALDAASTDADDCTLILISPHETFYNINTTGDPTWSANVILKGTHRLWAAIKNTHASATSVFKFTGKASLEDIAIFTQDSVNGVIFTKAGFRVRHCGFNSEGTSGTNKSICIDGSAAFVRGGILEEIEFRGNASYTTAIYFDTAKINDSSILHIHNCLTGIHIVNAASDYNAWTDIDIGDCVTGLDIDAGNEQHFQGITLHHNTTNVADEVGDHIYNNIHGEFPVTIEPEDLTGVTVTAGDGGWGSDTELRAAVTATKPFKVLGYTLAPSADENTLIRFSADSGTTFFTEAIFASKKNKATAGGEGTDFIFNVGTRISASVWSPAAGRTVAVSLEILEL